LQQGFLSGFYISNELIGRFGCGFQKRSEGLHLINGAFPEVFRLLHSTDDFFFKPINIDFGALCALGFNQAYPVNA
jgi:hypothetical protein